MREGENPIAEHTPLVQLVTSAIFQHIQKVFVGHSDRSLLIERGGQKLNHVPPKLLALYIGEITLAYEPVVIVVPATIVVKLVNHNTENRLARLVQMLTGEVLEGELLCLYLVHGGTAISCRADLVCIELLPPIERSGNIHRYENLTEELTVRCAATNEPGHKVFIIVTDCIEAPNSGYKVPGETPAPSEVDTTKLAAAIEKAEGLNESDYTKDSWKALQSELTKAKSALEAKESQDTVDKAADSLNKAIDALEAATPDEPTKEVSTDALEKAIKAAGALKESDYTADSWKALQSALAEADTALKEKKDQDTVDKATEKLNKAISALVKKDAGQKVNGTNGTTGTSGKSGKTGSTSNTKSGKAAKTGDPSGMFAWLGLAVTSLGAGIGGFSLKRRKREDEE